MESFFDRYKEAGSPNDKDVILNLLNDMMDEWHSGGPGSSNVSINEYLGLDKNEYVEFIMNPDFVMEMLQVRKLLK